ncbi:MAG: ATP synthase F0 subunit C [Elusimicrobia bacterium]|jgi:F-type H+-transporting ATPase subunit c|nr:ATP synthase F0 subunit C [Elusimicrobiota bacterium]
MNDLTFLGLGYIGAGLGAGLTLIGAGLGIGKLAYGALEGTARQPEAGGALRTTMIIAAALIEGLAFFALVICLLAVMNFAMPKGETAVSAPAGQVAGH